MKLFLSWSGVRSGLVAEALRDWLPDMMQDVRPWMSSIDLGAGSRWGQDLAWQLDGTSLGIVCITPENVASPWLLFEAGALAKTIDGARVCPYLLGLDMSEVQGPLTQFQMNYADEEGTCAIVKAINQSRGENRLLEERLHKQYQRCWPELRQRYQDIPPPEQVQPPKRSDHEILHELLEHKCFGYRLSNIKVAHKENRPGSE